MGRKSKLTEKQWNTISERLLAGEKSGKLAEEYGVSRSTIVERFSDSHGKVKEVANQILAAEANFNALDISDKIAVTSLADKLRSISTHLAHAGNYGAMTAHRLSSLANTEVQKIADVDPLQSLEAVKGVAILTKLANDSAEIGLNLLKANKDTSLVINNNQVSLTAAELRRLTPEEYAVLQSATGKLCAS